MVRKSTIEAVNTLGIRLDPKLYRRLKAVAIERKTSLNMLCRKLLEDALLVREVSLIIQTEKRRTT